jgi:Alginate lyase
MHAADDRPAPRRRRATGIIAAVVIVLAGLVLVGGGLVARSRPAPSVSPLPTPTPTPVLPKPGSPATGYLVTPADLADRIAKAAKGLEPWASARDELLADADAALQHAPRPVASLNIPDTEGPFVDDTATAYGLALAYAATGDVKYAQGARSYIMAWVDTTTELVNACADDGGCQTSLIVARVVPGFVFAADLIRPSAVMSTADEAALRAWLHDRILPILPTRSGNWGDAGNFSRAAISDYLGDREGFDKAMTEWRSRMDIVPPDGSLPDEVRRGRDGMGYTQEALQYKVGTARLAELRGTDLWDYVGTGGASLRTAVDNLAKYWVNPGAWPWDPSVRVPTPSPMWEIAYQHWKDPAWPAIFAAARPYGMDGHSAIRWTTLTNGIPIE